MSRMSRVVAKDVRNHRINRHMALDFDSCSVVLPSLQDQHRFQFDILGVISGQLLEARNVLFEPFLFLFLSLRIVAESSAPGCVRFWFGIGRCSFGLLFFFFFVCVERLNSFIPAFDQFLFFGVGFLQSLHGQFDKAERAFTIFYVRTCHSPVVHRVVRVERGRLAEGSFRFEVPETVKLSDPLVKEALSHRFRRRDRKTSIPHPGHEITRLTRPFVEGLGVHRVAWGLGTRVGGRRFLSEGCRVRQRCRKNQ